MKVVEMTTSACRVCLVPVWRLSEALVDDTIFVLCTHPVRECWAFVKIGQVMALMDRFIVVF